MAAVEQEPTDSEETRSRAKSTDIIKLLYLNADRQRQKKLIEALNSTIHDIDICVVLQADVAEQLQVCEILAIVTQQPWNCISHSLVENGNNNICLYYKEQSVGTELNSEFNEVGKFITISNLRSERKDYGALKIMAVNLPLKTTSNTSGQEGEDLRTAASRELQRHWAEATRRDPAIVIGNFNLDPNAIDTLLGNGNVGFKPEQNPTNANQRPRFVDNVYASRNLVAVEIVGDLSNNPTIQADDQLRHKVFTASYKLRL